MKYKILFFFFCIVKKPTKKNTKNVKVSLDECRPRNLVESKEKDVLYVIMEKMRNGTYFLPFSSCKLSAFCTK